MSEERNEIMFGESSNVVTKKHMKASTKRKIGNYCQDEKLFFIYYWCSAVCFNWL